MTVGSEFCCEERNQISFRTIVLVVAAIMQLVGCSQILGLKEPGLEDPSIGDASSQDTGVDGVDGSSSATRLWIFRTTGAFLGNAFGGTDNPPNVRGGADSRCLATYVAQHQARGCTQTDVRAILHVNSTDSIALMSVHYNIPTGLPVYRAEDIVLVADNWNALFNATMPLRASATTAVLDTDGVVWTGANTSDTCRNWTSTVSTDLGSRGYTNRTDITWANQDTFRCDRLASLLCICW